MERYVIHVTKECNMRCHYCYEKDKVSTYQWTEVKALIENLCDTNKEKRFGIEFLGGEPMLGFNLIVKTVEYIEKERSDIFVEDYIITTNGLLTHFALIDFMKTYPKVHFAISMDGTKHSNQLRITKEGKNSHDEVLKNFNILREWGFGDRIHFHITTHPYNIALLEESVEHLYNAGARSINVGTVESTMLIGKEYADRFIEEMNVLSRRICNGEFPGLEIGELNYMKPKEDTRYYIKDKDGKVIAESYGRAQGDITQTSIYNAVPTTGPAKELIEYIREAVYKTHQNRLKSRGMK